MPARTSATRARCHATCGSYSAPRSALAEGCSTRGYHARDGTVSPEKCSSAETASESIFWRYRRADDPAR